MRPEQWQQFKSAAKRQNRGGPIPLSLIVDCPWIPPYAGISHWDYFFDPEAWFQANLRVMQDFPDVIWFPSWWSEIGMGAEPSALGTRMHVYEKRIPDLEHLPFPMEQLDLLTLPNPRTDGFMPLCLYRFQKLKQRIFDAGYTIPVVHARGPLTIASFFRGVPELMVDIVDDPDRAKRLFDMTTQLAIDFMKAQVEVIGDCVEGILVLDDIVGFIGEEDYKEFAQPYLKELFTTLGVSVRFFHNDSPCTASAPHLHDTGINLYNMGIEVTVKDLQEWTDGQVTLMGNIPPRDVLASGTPEDVERAVEAQFRSLSDTRRILFSCGGGMPPKAPTDNIRAFVSKVTALSRR